MKSSKYLESLDLQEKSLQNVNLFNTVHLVYFAKSNHCKNFKKNLYLLIFYCFFFSSIMYCSSGCYSSPAIRFLVLSFSFLMTKSHIEYRWEWDVWIASFTPLHHSFRLKTKIGFQKTIINVIFSYSLILAY